MGNESTYNLELGVANANCPHADFVTFQNCKHQIACITTQGESTDKKCRSEFAKARHFKRKTPFVSGEGLESFLPRSLPGRMSTPVRHPISRFQPSLLNPPIRPPEFQPCRLTPVTVSSRSSGGSGRNVCCR